MKSRMTGNRHTQSESDQFVLSCFQNRDNNNLLVSPCMTIFSQQTNIYHLLHCQADRGAGDTGSWSIGAAASRLLGRRAMDLAVQVDIELGEERGEQWERLWFLIFRC